MAVNIHGEKCWWKLYFFYKKCPIATVENSKFSHKKSKEFTQKFFSLYYKFSFLNKRKSRTEDNFSKKATWEEEKKVVYYYDKVRLDVSTCFFRIHIIKVQRH